MNTRSGSLRPCPHCGATLHRPGWLVWLSEWPSEGTAFPAPLPSPAAAATFQKNLTVTLIVPLSQADVFRSVPNNKGLKEKLLW